MPSLGCQKGGTAVLEKARTKAPVADPIFPALAPASTSQLLLRRAVLDTRLALRDFLLAAGLQELRKAFEADRTLLCGPKGKVQTDRRAYRHGHHVGELVLGGRQVRIAKPRARSVDGCGLVLTAQGIDATGRKQVLGVAEGSSESEEVGKSLLQNLIGRGLVVERARLFVIDGGKGVRKAIRSIFGTWALIQRCQVHKMRNVLEHLPERQKAWVRAGIRRAWSAPTV